MVLDSAGQGLLATVTGSDGKFSFHLPSAGDYRLRTSRIGYTSSITKPIEVTPTVSANVILRLASAPISLDTVIVVAAAVEKRPQFLVDAGFYRRQRAGFGHFLTRADIEKRDALILSDLLQGMSGVRVICTGARKCSVEMRAGRSMFFRGSCRPSVVLDGVMLQPGGVGSRG